MQENITRLQEAEEKKRIQMEGGEEDLPITDEELEAAARELAEQEAQAGAENPEFGEPEDKSDKFLESEE